MSTITTQAVQCDHCGQVIDKGSQIATVTTLHFHHPDCFTQVTGRDLFRLLEYKIHRA